MDTTSQPNLPAPKSVSCLLALILAGSLSACATGPNFQEPEISWLADWQPELYGQARQQSDASDLETWWQRFEDLVLDELISQARQANPGLRVAGLRILESRALQGVAGGLRFPQVQQINASGIAISQRPQGGRNDQPRNFRTADVSFDIGWELDFWGRFRRGIESADAAYFASVANYHDVQVLLTAQVATLYYGYKTTLQRIEITQKNIALQKRSLEITQQLYDKGQSSELDLQQAKTQYLASQATIPSLQLGLTQQHNALCALLGRPPGELPELDGIDSSLPTLDPLSLRDLPGELLMRRPDVRFAAWQAAAQSAQVGVALSDLYPHISLGGSFGWSGNSLSAVSDVVTLAGGPALSWNIFNYGQIRNNVRVQDARLQQGLESFQNTVINAAREIDDSAARIAQTAASQTILEESLVAAQRSLELASRRYQEGYSDFQRVLDAQAVSFAQSDRTVANRGDHVAALIGLYRALGGGWRQASIESLIPAQTRELMQQRTNWGELLDQPLTPSAETTGRAP